jgi:hypothetical protein
VLQPGGHWLFNVWDAVDHNRIGALVHETVAAFFPTDPPQFFRAPFAYHDAPTGKRQEAQEHLTTATTMYREMGMTYWLERAEAESAGSL